MKKAILVAIASIVLTYVLLVAADKSSSDGVKYGTYINQRFQFQVKYPKELLFPQPPPDNNDGRTFLSKGKQVEMRASGIYNALMWSLQEAYQDSLGSYEDDKITYKVCKDNWFAISGYHEDKIFYRKRILVQEEGDDMGMFLTFYIEYPESEKELWNRVVGVCAKSLKYDESIEEGLEHIFK